MPRQRVYTGKGKYSDVEHLLAELVFHYTAAMPSSFVEAMDIVVLFLMFVAAPAIAIAIALAARRGLFKNFSRETHWTAYVFALIAAGILFFLFVRIDINGAWHTLLHFACGILGALVFGVAGGFMLSIFTSRAPIFSPSPRPKK